jgi:hypothetical protein
VPWNSNAAALANGAAAKQWGEGDRPISWSKWQTYISCGSHRCSVISRTETCRKIAYVSSHRTEEQTMTYAYGTILETRALTDAELASVSGGLFSEIVGAIAIAVADAYASGAIKAGCLMTPEGAFTACPKTPPKT